MTTLNEKAREYAEDESSLFMPWADGSNVKLEFDDDSDSLDIVKYNLQQAYIEGYTEALRWRDVNVELPEDNQFLIRESTLTVLKGRKLGTVHTNKVLVKYRNGDIDISTRCKCNGDNYYWWSAHESFESNNDYNIVAWRPIETI